MDSTFQKARKWWRHASSSQKALAVVAAGAVLGSTYGSSDQRKTYRLFISHSWGHNDEYYRLVDYLNEARGFTWENLSVPEHDPVTDAALRRRLRDQIKPASVVIILAGLYASHSDAIQMEIDIAQSLEKPIVGVRPWGNQRTSVAVRAAADEVVGWNTQSIVDAVRRHSP